MDCHQAINSQWFKDFKTSIKKNSPNFDGRVCFQDSKNTEIIKITDLSTQK